MQNTQSNIAFVCSSISWGGLEMNLLRLATWINQSKYQCILFCPENSRLHKEALECNIKVECIPVQRKYYAHIAALKLLRRLHSYQIRLVIFSHNRDMSMVASMKWLSKGKIISVYQQQMQLGVDKKDLLHTIRIKKIDAWVAPLQWLKKQALERTNISTKKVHVIPLATDISKWDYTNFSKTDSRKKLDVPMDAFILGVIGRLDPHKGQELLIQLLPEIQLLNPKIELLIVGENTVDNKGDYEQHLKNLCRDNGVSDSVHFRPFMKDTRSFFSAIDLFVMATNSETFGMVTTEAMISKVPILGSNSGGTPEILENGKSGYLFEPNSKESIIQVITGIIKQPESIISIQELAYQSAVQRFSHTSACQKYLDLFDDLLQKDS